MQNKTDFVSPTITISSNKSKLLIGESSLINFTLSEPSTNFTFFDVRVQGGILTNFSGSGATYTAIFTSTSVSRSGNIEVLPNTFTDLAGNFNYSFSKNLFLQLDRKLDASKAQFLEVEINNTPQTATQISSSITYYGQLSSNQDEDYFVFEAANSGLLSITFDNPKFGSLLMGPYFLIAVADNQESILTYKYFDYEDNALTYVIPNSGTYYLGIGNPGGFDWGGRAVWTDELYSITATFPSYISIAVIENSMRGASAVEKYGTSEIAYTYFGIINLVYGTSLAESISGTINKDYIAGFSGNDTINGGSGIDTAVYSGSAASYTLTPGTSSTTITDRTANRDGTDTLVGVERLKFSDTSIALDIQAGENAGMAYRMYKAALNRAPDWEGLGDWIGVLDNGGNIFTDLARGFTESTEFKTRYGPNLSNEAFVTLLYNNVLGRDPDQGGLNAWVGAIEQRGATREVVLHGFSESPENIRYSLSLIGQGMPYIE